MLRRIADVEGVLIVAMTAITAFMFAVAFTYPKLASEFPKLILGVTLAMLLYLLIGRLSGKILPSKVKGMGGKGPSWWLVSAALFFFYAAMGVLGFLPALVLLVAGLQLWIHGDVQGWPKAGDIRAGHGRRLLGGHDLCDADPHPARHAAVLQVSPHGD